MKQKLLFTVAFSLFFIIAINAQKIEYKGNVYEVKGNSILLRGYNVTESLTLDDQRNIRNKYEANEKAFREAKKKNKTKDKAEAKAARKQSKKEKKAKNEAKEKKKFLIF
ncbi:hypothetical protein [uncultured Formosa sp.]|uniref:hypothetical protein n=1 Tax=uncultured Formosa sp. TaxID=255435 RepID=UPI00261BB856|nr:hypothetical protein [uncultured Formosa sp.]